MPAAAEAKQDEEASGHGRPGAPPLPPPGASLASCLHGRIRCGNRRQLHLTSRVLLRFLADRVLRDGKLANMSSLLFSLGSGRVLRRQVHDEVLQGEPARRLPQVLRDLLRRLRLRAVRDVRPQGRVPLLPRHDHRPRQPHQAQVPMIMTTHHRLSTHIHGYILAHTLTMTP